MRRLGAVLAATSMAALLAVAAATPSNAAAAKARDRTSRFDGLWSVSIYTQTGACPASVRYPVRIYGGQFLQAEANPDYQIAGAVTANGAVGVSVSSHGQNATGYGRLTRTQGGGWWRTQYGDCTGVWQAIRR